MCTRLKLSDSILITAGRDADRWVTRAIALAGQSSPPQPFKVQYAYRTIRAVVMFATLVHGLTPKLGIWIMNVSTEMLVAFH